jgi:hypothetical protein
MALYKVYNGPMPTTVSQVAVTTSTALKTLQQLKPGPTQVIKVREWGISFDGSALATPGIVELCETDVAATVTAYVAADIHKYDALALLAGDPTTSMIAVGTAASGYTASAEGAITALRQGDAQQIMGMNQWAYQWVVPDGGFILQPGKFGRIRVKFAAGVNAISWMLIET